MGGEPKPFYDTSMPSRETSEGEPTEGKNNGDKSNGKPRFKRKVGCGFKRGVEGQQEPQFRVIFNTHERGRFQAEPTQTSKLGKVDGNVDGRSLKAHSSTNTSLARPSMR